MITQDDDAYIFKKIGQQLMRADNRNGARFRRSHAYLCRENARVEKVIFILVVQLIHSTELFAYLCVPLRGNDEDVFGCALK
mmetsp:Transcript_28260/g.41628  ORF Transcript_28260/g.41628 Transcript_28260/m.41628 type:complete len:82 (+) Transcript_28260:1947-2192(+)